MKRFVGEMSESCDAAIISEAIWMYGEEYNKILGHIGGWGQSCQVPIYIRCLDVI